MPEPEAAPAPAPTLQELHARLSRAVTTRSLGEIRDAYTGLIAVRPEEDHAARKKLVRLVTRAVQDGDEICKQVRNSLFETELSVRVGIELEDRCNRIKQELSFLVGVFLSRHPVTKEVPDPKDEFQVEYRQLRASIAALGTVSGEAAPMWRRLRIKDEISRGKPPPRRRARPPIADTAEYYN